MVVDRLFKRYEKWNPVHPTSGTFWGMGIGIGCGVGWGPGFGPEVVGYVGAGCGIGFSVGITLAGVGIGLPAKIDLETPYSALAVTGRSVLGFVQSSGLLLVKDYQTKNKLPVFEGLGTTRKQFSNSDKDVKD